MKHMKKKGNSPAVLLVWVSALFALFLVGVMTLYILDIFWNGTTGIFTSGTAAANTTTLMRQGIAQLFAQVPNVGKLAGVSLLIGVLALMGVGAYMGYSKLRK